MTQKSEKEKVPASMGHLARLSHLIKKVSGTVVEFKLRVIKRSWVHDRTVSQFHERPLFFVVLAYHSPVLDGFD